MSRLLSAAALITLVVSSRGAAAAEDQAIAFNRDIRPLLSDYCFACHGPDRNQRKAGLRLDVREAATDSGVLDPGRPESSELIARIESDDPYLVMPPPEHGNPLTGEEKALLRRWIAEGGEYQEHWSLTPLRRPEVPPIDGPGQSLRNEIDAFVLARLRREGVEPNPPADPRTLVRRLSFDLTGLPPRASTVESFVSDPSDAQYEALVESFLQSPHHGERLAMYWLDLVRYADSLGYHGDQERSVSPYRDYVIRAFNENKPFDQFTTEQLAGDLLPGATLEQKVASTYNRLNRASGEGGVQPEEYLAKYSADRVRTAGAVWLGSTFGCAECHDHKFDPFTAKDFYQFAAFFADIKEQGIVSGANHIATLPVPTESQRERQKELGQALAGAEQQYAETPAALEAAFAKWVESSQADLRRWRGVEVVSAESDGGAELSVRADGTVLAAGKNPQRDRYVLKLRGELARLSALRLAVLPHDSLPKRGPGRASNGNFVVHGVECTVDGEPVDWGSASATHSQANHAARHVMDGHENGWAILPEVGKANHLTLVAREPLEWGERGEREIVVRIRQDHGSGHNVGRLSIRVAEEMPEADPSAPRDPELASILKRPREDWSEAERGRLWDAFRAETPRLAAVRERIARLEQELASLRSSVVTTLGTRSTEPRTIRVLPRGNWMDDSGEIVEPNVPHFLPPVPGDDGDRLTRLDLARWMTSRDNPLVARAFVNRLWMLFSGNGLCRTVDDLGSQGQWPTHPALLDWLSSEFIDSGWDVRHMVRLMVNSAAYRRSSAAGEELRGRDPYNRLLARQSAWRLEAEMIRDNALSVSGLLDRKIGGPSVKPYQPAGYWAQLNFPKRTYRHDTGGSQYRRGLYTHWQRTFLHPSLLAFDAPAREECTAQRSRSNTPLQSLVLLNDPTYVEAARVLAERAVRSGGESDASRLRLVYRETLAREPKPGEMETLRQLLGSSRKRYEAKPEAADKLLETGLAPVAEDLDKSEIASWTAVTRAVLNLHETITRY